MSTDTEHGDMHGTEWDFPPIYPYPIEEPPVEEPPDVDLPDDPTDHEAFMDWVESRCGPVNDKQPVEQYDGTLGVSKRFVDNHESPVGLLQWNDDLDRKYSDPGIYSGMRWCTGTLVTEDLFLTAGHCFDSAVGVPKKGGQRIRPHEIATNMHVDFNYQVDPSGNLRTEQEFDIVDLVEHRVGGLDYAVVRLSGTPGNQFGTATLANTDVQQGDTLCIIQHPKGRPKKIEAGTATHIHTRSTSGLLGVNHFGYGDIDTLRGSSGSGVLRELDERLVGVHTNGGCQPPRSAHNHGVKITEILDESSVLFAPPRIRKPPGEGKLKFIDEGRFIHGDLLGKSKLTDDPTPGGGGRGTMKHINDRKTAGLDKQFRDTGGKGPGSDRFSGVQAGGGGMRPFVLQTPHHVTPGRVGQGGRSGRMDVDGDQSDLLATYEQILTGMQQFFQQQQNQLQALSQQYEQLVAEYETLAAEGSRQ